VSDQSFEQTFAEIYSEAYKLLCDKQERYGDSNIEQLGIHGVVGRIAHDKSARAKKFLNGKIVGGKVILEPFDDGDGESMADTLMDIANYALIAVALQRGKWGRPMDDGERTLTRTSEEEKQTPVDKKRKDKLPKNLASLRVDILGVKK
jgi:hypothetical protein